MIDYVIGTLPLNTCMRIVNSETNFQTMKSIMPMKIKYYRLVPENRRRKQTRKAILIGGHRGQWYPKSQLITRNGYIYASEWIYRKKRFK